MGNKLRTGQTTIKQLLAVILLTCFASAVYSQVPVTSPGSFEVSFTSGETVFTANSAFLSLNGLNSNLPGIEGSMTSFDEVTSRTENYYVTDETGSVAVGSRPVNEDIFFQISFLNQSGSVFKNLNIAFDFISGVFPAGNSFNLKLFYRIEDGVWNHLNGGTIQSSMLNRENENWNSFSIQLLGDDIFIREGETVELKWLMENTGEPSVDIYPIGVQRIELMPGVFEPEKIQNGDLIITEILPAFRSGDLLYEYIEIFNPTDRSVSLHGLEIKSMIHEIVIRKKAMLEPGQLFTAASKDMQELENFSADYYYAGSLVQTSGGMIELKNAGQEIAKATYEATAEGRALELDNAVNAFDGYTSLNNLRPSESLISGMVYGSPGEMGSTTPLYQTTFGRPGWYTFTPPGRINERLSRNPNLEMFSMDGSALNVDEMTPGEPVLIRKSGENPVVVYTEGIRGRSAGPGSVHFQRELSSMSGSGNQPLELNRIVNSQNERVAPAALIWDSEIQNFKLLYGDQAKVPANQPVFLNGSENVRYQIAGSGATAFGTGLDRFLEFRLISQSGNRREVLDNALLGFFNSPTRNSDQRFDLPKLMPLYPRDVREEERPEKSFLYLSSSLSPERANSFIHFPYELNRTYQFRLGYNLVPGYEPVTLDWSEAGDLPEDWIFTLTDNLTGTTVDMRDETAYRFTPAGEPGEYTTSRIRGSMFRSIVPDGQGRFTISAEPYDSPFQNQADSELPGSVELRQNYPNPFNPATNITFYLPEPNMVRIGIYNVVGQPVATLLEENIGAGEHSVVWNASDMPSGIYIVQLETGNRIFTRKITLIK